MKSITALFFLCCVFVTARAQQTFHVEISNGGVRMSDNRKSPLQVLDSAFLKCSYLLSFVKDAAKPEEVSTEEMLLLAGHKVSHFYSYRNFIADSLRASATAEQILNNPGQYRGGAFSYDIYKNYPDGKITTTDAIVNTVYKYEETVEISWEIEPDTLTVLGYSCQKATASFRGRDYTAWFTTDIPVNNGPWKFSGLPGLILKVVDAENHYLFECSGIELPKTKIPIGIRKSNYANVSRAEFNKVYSRFKKDPMSFLTGQMAPGNVKVTVQKEDGTPMKASDVPEQPYNPIER
ncbi:MAG: GLPGLI family protein [Prevotellaceae bacterium]|jgi:GLPGLI family protein|nr:GLPGLI family protein [Prevotellaceae bacterium]